MIRSFGIAALVSASAAFCAQAETGKIKIGYVNTFSGPNAFIGNDEKDGFELALDHLGRKMGNLDVQMIYEDDQIKPEVGRQVTEKLLQSDKVDIVTGYNWSNVLLASIKPAVDAKTFIISGNAGPSQLAGEACSPWFFSASWQNDQTPMALGELLNRRGVKKLFVLAPNYAAGKDMAAGVKKTFKGEVVGEEYTRWPGQVDFSTELSKVRSVKPDAVWVFYPGQSGAQFVQQYSQAGLLGRIPIYSSFTVDALTLPQLKELALGHVSTQEWVQDLDNPANKKFVADFRKKYGRYPSYYSAQNYDAAMLIASAVIVTGGKLEDKDAFRAALEKANFQSVRGKFRYNTNHFPIQDFYAQEVVKDAQGEYTMKTLGTVFTDMKDVFYEKCTMK
ncbi:MAG: branched-chain amino acid transport system substrate-binding protein [Methylobacteriaceae bacterium]|jgi:branched-chain amino acid transport system substrate-binding protein|nr:branched-chain amino acid transport system substrate-binding protein [Methylobacteriaceae bacterium]